MLGPLNAQAYSKMSSMLNELNPSASMMYESVQFLFLEPKLLSKLRYKQAASGHCSISSKLPKAAYKLTVI